MDYKLEEQKLYKSWRIKIDTSLELADILFDNNLDKVYFLRQYLKSFEIGNNTLEKVNQFTKVAN